jgi:site-specific DNA-methyltransferase (adenine-specific)
MESALNTIHCKDCIQGLAEFDASTVDLAFADPPFNIGYEYDVYHDRRDSESYLNWSRKWMGAVCRVLKPTGTFWLAIGDEYAAELKIIAQRDLGLTCRSWVVWYYTFGVNCTKKFSRSHAHLFHFVRDRKKFTFNSHAIRVPSARQTVYGDGRANPDGRLPDDTWILRPQDVADGFKPDEDTCYFPRVAGTFKERAGFHGCQMPEQLLGRIIRLCSNAGDLVLDPFAGSGTTLAVAKKLGRRWLGFELSEKYAKKATARLDSVREGQPLAGAPEPLVSAPQTPNAQRGAVKPPSFQVGHRNGDHSVSLICDNQAIEPADIERAIIAAYLATNRGFSTDRVLCDPELNDAFVTQCRRYGAEGDPTTWNRVLLRLRKAARLTSLPRCRRTSIPREDLDEYNFASEIAVRMLLDNGSRSLDEILCSPEQGAEFDKVARRFAPGFSSLQYRWAALRLRKRASQSRSSSQPWNPKRPAFQSVRKVQIERLKAMPGVYLLRDSEAFVYAGETLDIGGRISRMIEYPQPWQERFAALEIQMMTCEPPESWGFQSDLIKQRQPQLNYLKLGIP